MPRLVSLAVATHVRHVLPDVETREAALADEVLTTIEASAAGCLCCCHLALDADGNRRGYSADDWLAVVYEFAVDAQRQASVADDPPAVVRCSQEAARWMAIAIDALHRDSPQVTDALADALGCLLVVCVFADTRATPHAPTADSAALDRRSGARRNAVKSSPPRRLPGRLLRVASEHQARTARRSRVSSAVTALRGFRAGAWSRAEAKAAGEGGPACCLSSASCVG